MAKAPTRQEVLKWQKETYPKLRREFPNDEQGKEAFRVRYESDPEMQKMAWATFFLEVYDEYQAEKKAKKPVGSKKKKAKKKK